MNGAGRGRGREKAPGQDPNKVRATELDAVITAINGQQVTIDAHDVPLEITAGLTVGALVTIKLEAADPLEDEDELEDEEELGADDAPGFAGEPRDDTVVDEDDL